MQKNERFTSFRPKERDRDSLGTKMESLLFLSPAKKTFEGPFLCIFSPLGLGDLFSSLVENIACSGLSNHPIFKQNVLTNKCNNLALKIFFDTSFASVRKRNLINYAHFVETTFPNKRRKVFFLLLVTSFAFSSLRGVGSSVFSCPCCSRIL